MLLLRSALALACFAGLARLSAQPILQQVRISMLNGDVDGTLSLLRTELDHEPRNTIYRARLLESLGEQYHRLSDIDEAKIHWDEALRIRKQLFGDSSAEAAVGYAYQARYHDYMAAPQNDHQPVAWREADRARQLLRTRRGDVTSFERVHILREAGYAYKVGFGFDGAHKHEVLSRSRELYREALRSATSAMDTIWMAQVTHDIGNTFNDEAAFYRSKLTRIELRPLADSALLYYGNSIDLMRRIGMGTSEAVMMDHYTTALLLKGAYGEDSLAATTAAYDRALRTMLMQVGHPPDVDPLLYDPRIVNKAQMVELCSHRTIPIAGYPDTLNEQRLRQALASIEAAMPYWQAMLREYHSRDFYKVVGSYGHFPFQIGTPVLIALYNKTGERDLLLKAFDWYDLNRDALEQRDMLRAGARHARGSPTQALSEVPRLPEGTALVALHEHAGISTLYLDHSGPHALIVQKKSPPYFDGYSDSRAMHEAMENNDPHTYRRAAFTIYQETLARVLARSSYRELLLVPSEGLEGIPFEALVTDTLGEASWTNMHYLMDRCTVRYARTIHEALAKSTGPYQAPLQLAASQANGTSPLPFAQALVTALHTKTPGSKLFNAATRQDVFGLLNGNAPFLLASHAISPKGTDELPYLLLEDGPLSIRDIDSAHCNAPFVVLSTCSSGEGRIYVGEGAISLGNALLRGGAGAVVQTLWPVDDQATSEVLGLMYDGIDEGMSVSEALCEAKRAFVKKHADDALSNPFYWSGIVATGRDVQMATPVPRYAWWSGGVVVILLGIGARRFMKRNRLSRDAGSGPA